MLWQWVGWSVSLFGVLPPNRTQTMTLTHSGASELAQLMEGTTAGALIPEIVRLGLFGGWIGCKQKPPSSARGCMANHIPMKH